MAKPMVGPGVITPRKVLLIQPRGTITARSPIARGKAVRGYGKATIKFIADAAKNNNMLPHEFLLAIMRCEYVVINGVRYAPTFEQRMKAAESAAPYYAPKLASVEVWNGIDDDTLKQIIYDAAAEDPRLLKNISDVATGGAGGTSHTGATPPPQGPGGSPLGVINSRRTRTGGGAV